MMMMTTKKFQQRPPVVLRRFSKSMLLMTLTLFLLSTSLPYMIHAQTEETQEEQQQASCVATDNNNDDGEGSCNAVTTTTTATTNTSSSSSSSSGTTTDATTTATANDDNENNNDDETGIIHDFDKERQDLPKICEDQHTKCQHWADIGECTANPSYMTINCRRACELCADQLRINPKLRLMELAQGTDMGVSQIFQSTTFHMVTREQIDEHILSSREYMETKVKNGVMEPSILELCKNTHQECTIWAIAGECDNNPSYMKQNCAPACHSCTHLTVEGRCPLDPNAKQAWGPGDLNKMFEKLTSEPYLSEYQVNILASPHWKETEHNQGEKGLPWVITMENVVTEEEALRLIELGGLEGYERSADVGKRKADGTFDRKVSTGRTSTNAWCQHDCYNDTMAQSVIQRLTNLTGIDETNSEYLQLLRYEKGQYYNSHHDYIGHDKNRRQGVRILTVYLYLNDVPAGGGTNFDKLNLTVLPKRGRALLWPSVLDDDPNKQDWRTNHQALPVEEGIKYGANAWFHMRDFKTPNREHCQ